MDGVTGLSDGHRFGCRAWQRRDAPEHQHLDIGAAWNGGARQAHTTTAQTTDRPRPNSTPTCVFGNAEAHIHALHRHRAHTDQLGAAPASKSLKRCLSPPHLKDSPSERAGAQQRLFAERLRSFTALAMCSHRSSGSGQDGRLADRLVSHG